LLLALTATLLSGCATVIKGSSQNIVVTTPPVSGANCVLTSKEGSWVVTSPGTVHVEKSKEDVLVKCTKPGYQDAAATIPSDFQGWTIGNVILGGLIGVGVDAATGALNEYPHSFAVPMTPLYGQPYYAPQPYQYPPPPPKAPGS
jgi:hypothetical protein